MRHGLQSEREREREREIERESASVRERVCDKFGRAEMDSENEIANMSGIQSLASIFFYESLQLQNNIETNI